MLQHDGYGEMGDGCRKAGTAGHGILTAMDDQIRAWFGDRRLAEDEARARAFWAGEGRCLVSVQCDPDYRQQDLATMRRRAPQVLREQAALPGCNIPSLFADFGTVSMARPWGGRELSGEGGKPHLAPVTADLQAALDAPVQAVEHPDGDVARALHFFQQLSEDLATDRLWLRGPDMQGTLNTAALVVEQTALMMAMYESPELLAAFLERVCDRLIAVQEALRRGSGDRLCGNIWPWVWLPPESGLSLTEDYMPLLGPDQYARFGLPYLEQLSDRFGPVLMHCCGKWGRHVANLHASRVRFRAVEIHCPLTTVDEVAPLAEAGCVIVPFLNQAGEAAFGDPVAFCRHLLQTTPWRYWFALGDGPMARAFAIEVAEAGLTPD